MLLIGLAAAEYDQQPTTSLTARRAYRGLAHYTESRYGSVLDAGWVTIPEYTGTAPDLDQVYYSKQLPVYNLKHGHPEFTDETNFRFRAVHDIVGHLGFGAGLGRVIHPFGIQGEIAAARAQVADIKRWAAGQGWAWDETILACIAAFGEIVGQAAYFDVHGQFPEQKAVILREAWGEFIR